MKRASALLTVAAVVLAALGGCHQTGTGPGPEHTAADPKLAGTPPDPALVDANTEFALKLTRALAADSTADLFLSPASVSMALAMTWNGAKDATKDDMAEALELHELSMERVNLANSVLLSNLIYGDDEVELHLANSLWAREDRTFAPDFLDRNRSYYGAEITSLRFDDTALARINGWVEDHTNGKITDVLDQIPGNAILYLINAIYFKGTWTNEFDPEDTADGPFALADGREITVPIMRRDGMWRYAETDSFQAVSLPYGADGRFSMYVFLPEPEASLAGFIATLDADTWGTWMALFREMQGIVALPRFGIEYKTLLNDVLVKLGMGRAFNVGGGADFSGMMPDVGPGGVWISRVIHQTYLDVNEEGTEAAGATVVEMREFASAESFSMSVDRPFFLAICDNLSGAVLFTGAVYEPQ